MASRDDDLPLDEAAALHDALGHPVRVAILRLLRSDPEWPLARLRIALEVFDLRPDTRSLKHHLRKMERASLVDLYRERGRWQVRFVRDVRLVSRLVPPAR